MNETHKLNVLKFYLVIPYAVIKKGQLYGSESCNYSKNITFDNMSDILVPIIIASQVINFDS